MGNGISSALDPSRGQVTSIPEGYTTPQWPSLYHPSLRNTEGQRGIFLYEAETIWHFTLYWTFVLDCTLFMFCSVVASITLTLSIYVFRPPSPPPSLPHDSPSNMPAPKHAPSSASSGTPPYHPGSPRTATTANTATAPITPVNLAEVPLMRKIVERPRRKRPPLWPILILPLVVTGVSGVVALVTGTVMGFALAAVYSAGGFSMSTWIPMLWALIQVLVLIISSYSTLTSIL